MEIKNNNTDDTISSLIEKLDYFNTLKQDEQKPDLFTAEIKVTGYHDLILTVSDLLKASILALDSEPPYVSGSIFDPEINVITLLEIALQLLPQGEIELLDQIHKMHLHQKFKAHSDQ